MKRAKTTLDFFNDKAWMFGMPVKLQSTDSGHYFISLAALLHSTDAQEVLFSNVANLKSPSEKKKIAVKLHKQFSHPSSEKICGLVKSSGFDDSEFIEILKKIPSECDVCLRFKKTPSKPSVGLPLASYFNELVAADIK